MVTLCVVLSAFRLGYKCWFWASHPETVMSDVLTARARPTPNRSGVKMLSA